MKIAVIVIIVIFIFGMVGYLFLGSKKQSSLSSASVAPSPVIPVKDYAPSVPMNQKTTILIQTSDSSDMKYIVPTDQVETYVKSLPEGYRVVSKTP